MRTSNQSHFVLQSEQQMTVFSLIFWCELYELVSLIHYHWTAPALCLSAFVKWIHSWSVFPDIARLFIPVIYFPFCIIPLSACPWEKSSYLHKIACSTSSICLQDVNRIVSVELCTVMWNVFCGSSAESLGYASLCINCRPVLPLTINKSAEHTQP